MILRSTSSKHALQPELAWGGRPVWGIASCPSHPTTQSTGRELAQSSRAGGCLCLGGGVWTGRPWGPAKMRTGPDQNKRGRRFWADTVFDEGGGRVALAAAGSWASQLYGPVTYLYIPTWLALRALGASAHVRICT